MPCDWKDRLGQWISHITEPTCTDQGGFRLQAALALPGTRGRRFNPVTSPPAWLARRNKMPAQRGGPRQ